MTSKKSTKLSAQKKVLIFLAFHLVCLLGLAFLILKRGWVRSILPYPDGGTQRIISQSQWSGESPIYDFLFYAGLVLTPITATLGFRWMFKNHA